MRIGYDRLLTKKAELAYTNDVFLLGEVDKVIVEDYIDGEVYLESSCLTNLLSTMQPNDVLVIKQLECVSESASIWHQLLLEMQKQKFELEVILSPTLTVENWLEVMRWWQPTIEKSKKSRIISIGKEQDEEAKQILPFNKKSKYRKLYWKLFKEINQGASLRRTAKKFKVSQGTVLRVKRDVGKLQQSIWLVGTFGITVASLKIAQAYSTNSIFQVIICAVATALIIYLSYSDIKEAE